MKNHLFGLDISWEFQAPAHLISCHNVESLKDLFSHLVREAGMEPMGECMVFVEDDNLDPALNGPTVIQAIKTSAIVMHLWPELSYGRLTISTCKPEALVDTGVRACLTRGLEAQVFYCSKDRWHGPHSSGLLAIKNKIG